MAVTVTIAAALAFQPVRRRLESAGQHKAVRRSRTAVPATQESRHDDGADRRTRRAAASTRACVRDGIGTSWVQVRLRDADGSWLEDPVGVAGEVTGDSAAGVDLVRAGELVG
ncbi:MAG TPA: hypothetical protein VFY56_10750, partial [Propionibacteriaceae bacterium]|nr:hypothetical protein [Propionibacteriaceae bacterium]